MILRTAMNASWYVPNHVIQKEISLGSRMNHYTSCRSKLTANYNGLARKVVDDQEIKML